MHSDTRPTAIPGVETFHRRETWQEAHLPVTGPRIAWPTIDIVAVHYPWAEPTAGSLDDILKIREFLRRTQRDYVLNRGYSIGYSFHVDWLGGVWEARGFDIRCAANRTVNPRTIAIQVLVDWDGPATDLALASVRAIHAEVERRAQRECPSLGHNMLPDPDSPTGFVRTSCAGAGLTTQIAAGLTTPDSTPPPEEDDMPARYWRDERYHDVFQISPSVAPVPSVPDGAVVEVGRHHRTLRAAAKMCQITTVSRWEDWAPVDVDSLPDDPS